MPSYGFNNAGVAQSLPASATVANASNAMRVLRNYTGNTVNVTASITNGRVDIVRATGEVEEVEDRTGTSTLTFDMQPDETVLANFRGVADGASWQITDVETNHGLAVRQGTGHTGRRLDPNILGLTNQFDSGRFGIHTF